MSSISNAQVGIDVHKDTLRISIDQSRPFQVGNNESEIQDLIRRIPEGAMVHLEASGGYERLLKRILHQRGIACKVHNPRKIDRLADALGRPAKTDDLDAMHLCKAGPLVKGHEDKSTEQEELCDFSRSIHSLKTSRAKLIKQARKPGLPEACVRAFGQAIASLTKQIEKLEKLLVQRIAKSNFEERYKLALSVPCIGSTTAATLVSELPADLHGATTQQIIAYAGLAPKDDSSGKRNGPRHVQPGNMHLKRATYMCALSAISSLDWAKDLYARLRAKGRVHQQAIVAVMRKLLVRVIAVIKRGTAYQAVPPKNLQIQIEP